MCVPRLALVVGAPATTQYQRANSPVTLWSTLKKESDIGLGAERLEQTLGPLPRDLRTLLNKSAKSLDLAHVELAKKDRQI